MFRARKIWEWEALVREHCTHAMHARLLREAARANPSKRYHLEQAARHVERALRTGDVRELVCEQTSCKQILRLIAGHEFERLWAQHEKDMREETVWFNAWYRKHRKRNVRKS